MSIEKVKTYFAQVGMADRIMEFTASCATVDLAAAALGCEPAHIAKTLSFADGADGCLLVVAAGDAKVDNKRFKAEFGVKPRMLSADDALRLVGHAVGGVCPFALNAGVPVYLDESLRRFKVVYPAAGSANSAIRLSVDELFALAGAKKFVDVCKAWREEEQV